MGTWRSLRVAFILGSLFMLLLIIAYWDDIGGFSLYPFQDLKHDSLHSDCGSQRLSSDAALSASTIGARSGPSVSLPITSRIPLSPEDTAQTHPEEEQKKPPWENARKEGGRNRVLAGDGDQDVRKQMIADVCSGKTNVEFPGRTRVIEQIPYRELDHLIVDDTHQIIYCYVPKVACTNWKKVLVVLSQALISPSSGKPYIDPEAVPAELVHNSSLHLTFAKFWHHYGSLSRYLMALKLQRYTKFLFVRDPFVRLISAFRNKFGRPNEDFYKQFGSVMLRRFGNVSGSLPETAAEAFAAGIKPTFQQFIAYLLDPETEKDGIFNEHWRQVYRLCHPCQVKYDFIGHLETLEEDTERLLKILKVDHLLHFPSGAHNLTSTSWERDWFAQIPIATRKELYKLYEPDFDMFGYAKPDGLLQQELD